MASTMGRSAYGGAQRIDMQAPQAPTAPNAQGAAVAGQNRVLSGLTAGAQQVMGVPRTPVKGLLNRMVPAPTGQMQRSAPMAPRVLAAPGGPMGMGYARNVG